MSLQDLLAEGRLEQRAASKQEIDDLLQVASRCLADSAIEQMSLDGRFNCAYDAALMLATVPLRCKGYRTRGEGHHLAIFETLPLTMGEQMTGIARYLQKCRKIRNISTYSRSGIVSPSEVKQLLEKTRELEDAALELLKSQYPQYR